MGSSMSKENPIAAAASIPITKADSTEKALLRLCSPGVLSPFPTDLAQNAVVSPSSFLFSPVGGDAGGAQAAMPKDMTGGDAKRAAAATPGSCNVKTGAVLLQGKIGSNTGGTATSAVVNHATATPGEKSLQELRQELFQGEKKTDEKV